MSPTRQVPARSPAVEGLVNRSVGGSLLGIVGALLAVPTAAILQVIATEVMKD